MSLFDTLSIAAAGPDATDSLLRAMNATSRRASGIPYLISELAYGATASVLAKLDGMDGPNSADKSDSSGNSNDSNHSANSSMRSLYSANAMVVQSTAQMYGSLLDTFDTENDDNSDDGTDSINNA